MLSKKAAIRWQVLYWGLFLNSCLLAQGTIPNIITYRFTTLETKTLPGTSTELARDAQGKQIGNCDGKLNPDDQIGNLALKVRMDGSNWCQTDGKYNNNDYKVDAGLLVDNTNSLKFQAYRIYEPAKKANKFLSARHVIYYKFPTKENYTIYHFDEADNKIVALHEVPAGQITLNEFTVVGDSVSDITGSRMYVFVPSSQRFSVFTPLKNGVEAARLNVPWLGDVIKYRFPIKIDNTWGNANTAGNPFDVKRDLAAAGPSSFQNIWSFNRQFYLVPTSQKTSYDIQDFAIVWQDREDNSIFMTYLYGFLTQYDVPTTRRLRPFPGLGSVYPWNERLVALTHDFQRGFWIYMVSIEGGDGRGKNGSNDTARKATFTGISSRMSSTETGTVVWERKLDTSAEGMDITCYKEWCNAALRMNSGGDAGLILARFFHKGADGVNHQGATRWVFDSDELKGDIYEITDEVLTDLQEKIPNNILNELAPLTNRRIVTTEAFVDSLKARIGQMATDQYLNEIAEAASTAYFQKPLVPLKSYWLPGHGISNTLTTDADQRFVGLQLADSGARGVNITKFDRQTDATRVVFTSKELHQDQATDVKGTQYPPYFINYDRTQYYKWSANNQTFIELGNVIPVANGYIVTFIGEPNPNNFKALDSTRVAPQAPQKYLVDARNLGMVKVRKDFENLPVPQVSTESWVTDDLILNAGIPETGNYYDDAGRRNSQRNTGVHWLTNYTDKSLENATRLKSAKLSNGEILLVWEKWTSDTYANTYAMTIDDQGGVKRGPVSLGSHVRLTRQDDMWVYNDKAYLVDGDRPKDGQHYLEVVVLDMNFSPLLSQ